jgi:hypothetical protein
MTTEEDSENERQQQSRSERHRFSVVRHGFDRMQTLTWSRAPMRPAFGGHDDENPFTNACESGPRPSQRGIAPERGGCRTRELSL